MQQMGNAGDSRVTHSGEGSRSSDTANAWCLDFLAFFGAWVISTFALSAFSPLSAISRWLVSNARRYPHSLTQSLHTCAWPPYRLGDSQSSFWSCRSDVGLLHVMPPCCSVRLASVFTGLYVSFLSEALFTFPSRSDFYFFFFAQYRVVEQYLYTQRPFASKWMSSMKHWEIVWEYRRWTDLLSSVKHQTHERGTGKSGVRGS